MKWMFCDSSLGLRDGCCFGHMCPKILGFWNDLFFAFGEGLKDVMRTYIHERRLLIPVPCYAFILLMLTQCPHRSSSPQKHILFKPYPPPQRHARIVNTIPKSKQQPSLPQISSHHSLLLQILRTRIPNPILLNRKKTITLRQTRTIINPTNPRLPPPLLQTQPRRTRMRNNISPNRFLRIRIKHRARAPIHLRNNLIRDHNSDTEFISETL